MIFRKILLVSPLVLVYAYTMAQPANDNFANAIDVSGIINSCSADAAYTTVSATSDLSVGSCWNTAGGGNVWFKFIATTTQVHVDIKTGGVEGSARYIYGALWQSDGTTQLACQRYFNGSVDDIELGAVGLTMGSTYYISVDNHNGSGGAYEGTFTICLNDAVNYNFYEGANDVTSLINSCSANAAYTTIGATADKNPGTCWNTTGGFNRWFKFTASTAQIKVDIKTGGAEGSARYIYGALYEADGVTELACARYFSGSTDDIQLSAVGLTPTNTYYIAVDNHNGSGGAYKGTFTLCLSDAVDYDYYEGANLLSDLTNWCSANAAYSTIGATADKNPGSCWNTTGGFNRWFKFVATTAEINIDIKTGGVEGSARYMYGALWESDGVTEIACERYFNGSTNDLEISSTSLTPGNTYYISVDNHNGSGGAYKGTFTLCINDKVTYDFYENAILLTDLNNWCSANAAYTTIGATKDKNPGSCWNTTGGFNRWFKFVAISPTVTYNVNTGGAEGSARYLYTALWQADGVTEIACARYVSGSTDDLMITQAGLTVGNTYYISVDDHNGSGGAYKGTFSLCIDNVDQTFYSRLDGAWTNVNTWSSAGIGGAPAVDYPKVGDIAIIEGYTITISGTSEVAAEVNLNAATNTTGITISAGGALDIAGQFIITNPGNNINTSISVTNSSLTVDDLFTINRNGGTASMAISLDNSTLTLNKDFTLNSTAGTNNNTIDLINSSVMTATEGFTLSNTGGPKTLVTINNSTFTVTKDLTFSASADNKNEIALTNTGILNLKKDVVRGTPAYGILNCATGTTVNFNSSDYLQTFPNSAGSGTGDTFTYQDVTVNNSRITTPQLSLDGPVTINGTLTLTDGEVSSTSTNLLTLAAGAAVTGASQTSFVDGPVKKIGNTSFEFPVGDNNFWQPISIANLTGDAATEFTAQYFVQTPTNNLTLKSPDPNGDLNNISGLEYWDLTNTGTASNADVTLHWKDQTRSDIDNAADLQIAHYTGTEWENLGQSSISFADPGNITVIAVSSFSPFTFGSLSNGFNALPVELVSFEARAFPDYIQLRWETASENNNDFFSIEKSLDGEHFFEISKVNGYGTSSEGHAYHYEDYTPLNGVQYFRLRQVDFDGAFEYSPITIVNYKYRLHRISIYPNPTENGRMTLYNSGKETIQKIDIFSIRGDHLIDLVPTEIDQKITLFLDIDPGIYIVVAHTTSFQERLKVIVR